MYPYVQLIPLTNKFLIAIKKRSKAAACPVSDFHMFQQRKQQTQPYGVHLDTICDTAVTKLLFAATK